MKSFINDVADNWSVDLTEDSTLFQFLPMLNLTLVNTGDSKVEIYIHGQRIGSCFGYSVFSLIGKPFETFRVTGTFNIGDIEVIASKIETVAVMPYNPQIDLMEENLDKFASGTNSRLSLSSTTSLSDIKYMINAQNQLIVQRKLDVLGGASVGSYEIDFSGDIISGSTAVNFPTIDIKRYKKTIVNCTFDYSVTDCAIKGWMIDYNKNSENISNEFVEVTCLGANPIENSFDGDLNTYTDGYTTAPTTWTLVFWEVSFPIKQVDVISTKVYCDSPSSNGSYKVQVYSGGSWIDTTILNNEGTFHDNDNTGYADVTGIRLLGKVTSANYALRIRLHDITVIPV